MPDNSLCNKDVSFPVSKKGQSWAHDLFQLLECRPELGCMNRTDTDVWAETSATAWVVDFQEGVGEFRFRSKEVKPVSCFSGLFIWLKHDGYKMFQGTMLGLWDRLDISIGEMTLVPKNRQNVSTRCPEG